jgi:AcrR family transcriptional regulator
MAHAPDLGSSQTVDVARPIFRRATPADAFELAHTSFLANERLDLQKLAGELGVARTTLHRWVGTREQLLDQVLGRLASDFFELARGEAQGEGDELVVDLVSRLVGTTSRFEPARGFVQREPQLALRLLIGERFSVRRSMLERMRALLVDVLPGEAAELDGFAQSIIEVGAALEWSSVLAGDEPSSERIAEIVRGLLIAARAGVLPGSTEEGAS